MPLLAILDHLRRTSRCWFALVIVLGGAFLLPQVGAAGASPTVTPLPAAVNAPPPGPDDRLSRRPPPPECPPHVLTCDDVTIDPCVLRQTCPPPPTPCEQDIECPPPPPPPPPECEKADPACPEPPPVTPPEPTDRPVPARPDFTG
jgi:hypothetical protein